METFSLKKKPNFELLVDGRLRTHGSVSDFKGRGSLFKWASILLKGAKSGLDTR